MAQADITEQGVNAVSSYQYDVNGIRNKKVANGETFDYLVDDNRAYAQVVRETNATTGNVTDYLYGDDLIKQTQAANDSYYLYDGLGSTRALTNSAGAITDTYNYESFGTVLNQTGSTPNNYLFTGEQYDNNLDNYYLRARYYDQGIGRFTQMDTWMGNNQDPVTLHKYLYANVDPINNVDPTGNFSMASVMTAVNIASTLATIASTTVEVFSIASGESEFSAVDFGINLLLNRLPVGLVNKLRKKFKKDTGQDILITCLTNSFVSGTLVHTKRGLIPIEDVEIGDFVLSYNEATGDNRYQVVTHLIRGENEYDISKIQLKNGEFIAATSAHPFYVNSEWVDASDISLNDEIQSLDGIGLVSGLSLDRRNTSVYNLTVNNTHTYYVGHGGVLVHNANRDCIQKVANIGQFFKTQFGVLYKNISRSNGKAFHNSPIHVVTKKNSGPLKKGDRFYLDKSHDGDHLEVFDKNGNLRGVYNIDGIRNEAKTNAAIKKGRSLIKDLL